MSDRKYQESAKQQNPDGHETQKQKPSHSRQQPKQQAAKQPQVQLVKLSDASANKQNNNDIRKDGTYNTHATQSQAPPGGAYYGYPQQQHATNDDLNSQVDETSTPWADPAFSEKIIRLRFIRKVYLILTFLLLVSLVFVCIFLFVEPVKKWVHDHSWFLWVSLGVYIVTCLMLSCCKSVARTYPCNFICLGIFNLAFSYVLAAVSSYYSTAIVLIAVGITALVCMSVSIFAIQTKIDFTLCGGLIFVLAMVLMLFGIAVLIVGLVVGRNYILTCVYGACAALVFTLFLAYDTQLIMGGRKHQISSEDYILGALMLYMDVGMLYLIILSFFSNDR